MGLGAAQLIRDRAAELEPGGDVPSPCISVCTMNPDTGLCIGCYRTLDEIAAWGRASQEERRAIWKELVGRAQREDPQP